MFLEHFLDDMFLNILLSLKTFNELAEIKVVKRVNILFFNVKNVKYN